jgi:hypothetical protein
MQHGFVLYDDFILAQKLPASKRIKITKLTKIQNQILYFNPIGYEYEVVYLQFYSNNNKTCHPKYVNLTKMYSGQFRESKLSS